MACCDCQPPPTTQPHQRKILLIALVLNAAMAAIGLIAGWLADSAGLLADALDMFCDATAYAIGLAAVGRSLAFKVNAARLSGVLLLLLGLGLLAEAVRRVFEGAEPQSGWMVGTALLSLLVNITVLRLLAPLKSAEVHLRATWIFTRADVVANLGVILAGLLVLTLASPLPDLVIGGLIALYVIREAIEILRDARTTDSTC